MVKLQYIHYIGHITLSNLTCAVSHYTSTITTLDLHLLRLYFTHSKTSSKKARGEREAEDLKSQVRNKVHTYFGEKPRKTIAKIGRLLRIEIPPWSG